VFRTWAPVINPIMRFVQRARALGRRDRSTCLGSPSQNRYAKRLIKLIWRNALIEDTPISPPIEASEDGRPCRIMYSPEGIYPELRSPAESETLDLSVFSHRKRDA
jgi:hypothetical protein